MQQPDPRLGAGALAAANCQRRPTTESTPTTRASAPTTSQRMRPAVEPMLEPKPADSDANFAAESWDETAP